MQSQVRIQFCLCESVRVAVLTFHGPDAGLIFLERINVDHPVEDDGMEGSARSVAALLSRNRSAETKLRMRTEIFRLAARRCGAEINVLVPLCNAQRNAFVELIFGEALGRCVHYSDQFVIVTVLFIQQRRRMIGIETHERFHRKSIIGEVVHLLRNLGMKNLESLVKGDMVVEIFF